MKTTIMTFSPSHRSLFYYYFLSSFPLNENLIITQDEQRCPSGDYFSPGWNLATASKIDYILQYFPAYDDNLFYLFSDADVQFFPQNGSFCDYVDTDYDMLFQDDGKKICAGFFFFRCCQSVYNLLNDVKKNILKSPSMTDDQDIINEIIGDYDVKYKKLPKNKFWSAWQSIGDMKKWVPGIPLNVPRGILVHHANWTVGIKNKILMMNEVRRLIL